MSRQLLLTVPILGLLGVSCVPMSEFTSPEPIELSSLAQQQYSSYLDEISPDQFFVTEDGFGGYYTYCPDPGGACRGAGFGIAAGIRNCENAYGRKCYLYALKGKVIERDE